MNYYKIIRNFFSNATIYNLALAAFIAIVLAVILLSLLWEVIMPVVNYLLNIRDLSDLKIILIKSAADKREVALEYGSFLRTFINVILVAFSVLMGLSAINGICSFKKNGLEKRA